MSKFYLQTITDGHKLLMEHLGSLFKDQLLIGGTALSLQIGHRQSEDLDFVIKQPVPKNITIRFESQSCLA